MTESGIGSIPVQIQQGCYGSYLVEAQSHDRMRADCLGSWCPKEATKDEREKLCYRFAIHDSPAAALVAFTVELAKIPAREQWTALSRFRSGRYESLRAAQENKIVHYLGEVDQPCTSSDVLRDAARDFHPEIEELMKTHVPTLWTRPEGEERVGTDHHVQVEDPIPAGIRILVRWEPK